jgi:peptidoglycan/LPS O-acetylase OafA/YrhL
MRSSGGEHFLGLDHVRALAAFMVFSWHFTHSRTGWPVPFAGGPAVFPLAIFDEGHTGVALFMTLSGYLFAKLLDGKDVHFPSFLWNRFIRLAPLMILVLVFAGAEDVYHGSTIISVMNQYIKGMILGSLPNGLWSVIVEAHFYLILPLLMVAFNRFQMAALEPDSKITFLDLRPWRGVA